MIEWLEELRSGLNAEFGLGPKVVTLATVDDQGRPRARSVVVRAVRDSGSLVVASDARSRKNAHVRLTAGADVCAWLPKLKRQFRLSCRAGVIGESSALYTSFEDDVQGLRDGVWGELSESARALFFWPSPGAVRAVDASLFPQSVRTGLAPSNFELIYLRPREVDLLDLSSHPHHRRVWERDGAQWAAREINP